MSHAAVLLGLLGTLLLVIGAWLIYPPAGVITAGVVLLVIAYAVQYWKARE